jgi:hypothetical protein
MSPANIKLRIAFVETDLKKLNKKLKSSCGNAIEQGRLIEKIRLKEGELIGLKWCLK